jgi:hypothetical protein
MTIMGNQAAVLNGLITMNGLQRAAVAAGCAESMSSIINGFGAIDTHKTFSNGLASLWRFLSDELARGNVADIRNSVYELEEVSCDDSNIRAYPVMVALGVFEAALRAAMKRDDCKVTQSACTLAFNASRDLDVGACQGGRVNKIGFDDELKLGPLGSAQEKLQLRLIDMAGRSSSIDEATIHDMRSMSVDFSLYLKEYLFTYANRRGWSVNA